MSRGEDIQDMLLRQMTSSVRWIDTVRNMFQAGMSHFVECAPKPVLSRMVGQILAPAEEGEPMFTARTISTLKDAAAFSGC
jgi:[acyl-carrier-protein] S-malonyltransferase